MAIYFNRDYKLLHTNQYLTNFAVKYSNGIFVADAIAPIVPVDRASDKYPIYAKERFQWENTARRDKSDIGISTESWTDGTYSTMGYALGDWLSKKEMANIDSQLRGSLRTVEYLREKIALDREVRTTALAVADASFATGHTADALVPWDLFTDATADPLYDIELGIEVIKAATFKMPDTLLLGWKAALKLALHPKVVAYRQKVGDMFVSQLGLPPTLLGLKVVVSQSGYSTSKKNATISLSNVLGNYAVVYCAGSPQYGDASFLQTFQWAAGRGNDGWEVEESYDGRKKATFISVEPPEWNEKCISTSLGYRIGNVLTA
jgi:hypothetical protein